MEIESITFEQGKLTVVFVDGTTKVYTDRASYVADYPEREADCDAVGML